MKRLLAHEILGRAALLGGGGRGALRGSRGGCARLLALLLLIGGVLFQARDILAQSLEPIHEAEHHGRRLRALQDALLHHLAHRGDFQNLVGDDELRLVAAGGRERDDRNLLLLVRELVEARDERLAELVPLDAILDAKLEDTVFVGVLHLVLEDEEPAVKILLAVARRLELRERVLVVLAGVILAVADEARVALVRETLATAGLRQLVGADAILVDADENLVAVIDATRREGAEHRHDAVGELGHLQGLPHLPHRIASEREDALVGKIDRLPIGDELHVALDALEDRRLLQLVILVLGLGRNPLTLDCVRHFAFLCPLGALIVKPLVSFVRLLH